MRWDGRSAEERRPFGAVMRGIEGTEAGQAGMFREFVAERAAEPTGPASIKRTEKRGILVRFLSSI